MTDRLCLLIRANAAHRRLIERRWRFARRWFMDDRGDMLWTRGRSL